MGVPLKVDFAELPPAPRFFQVSLFKLRHDLAWDAHTWLHQRGLAGQVCNRSDVLFASHGLTHNCFGHS